MLIAWSLVIGGFVFLGAAIGGFALQHGGFIAGPLMLLAGALWGIIGCRTVYPKKIDDDYVWLHGVCPEFLAQYEEHRV